MCTELYNNIHFAKNVYLLNLMVINSLHLTTNPLMVSNHRLTHSILLTEMNKFENSNMQIYYKNI